MNFSKDEFEIIKLNQLSYLTPIFHGQGAQQNHGIILNSFSTRDALLCIPVENSPHKIYKTILSPVLSNLLEDSFFINTMDLKSFNFIVSNRHPGGTVQLSLEQILDPTLSKNIADSLFKPWYIEETYADGLLIAKYAKPYSAQLFYRGLNIKLPDFPGLVFQSAYNSSSEFLMFRPATEFDAQTYGIKVQPKGQQKNRYVTGKNEQKLNFLELNFHSSNPLQLSKNDNYYIITTIADSFIKRKSLVFQSIEESIISDYGVSEVYNNQQIKRVFENKGNGQFELQNEKIEYKDCKISHINQEMVRLTESSFTNLCGDYWILYY